MDAPVDVVVLGGDLAAGVASARLARAGAKVHLVAPPLDAEPRRLPATTLGGGGLERSVPDLAASLPTGRTVVQHRLGFLTSDSSVFVDFLDAARSTDPVGSRSVRTGDVVGWTARVAAAAGATTTLEVSTVRVEGTPHGGTVGVTVDGTPLRPRLVLVSDPAWGRPLGPTVPPAEYVAAGLWSVEPAAIERRFSVRAGEGASLRCVLGNLAPPVLGVGSVTTLADAVEVRVVVHRVSGAPTEEDARTALATFAAHPAVAPLLRDASPGPTSIQAVTEWPGAAGVAGPALWRMGEAAGLRYSNLLVQREGSFAVQSGRIAADAAAPLLRSGGPVGPTEYRRGLSAGGITAAMRQEQNARRWRWDSRIHREYPAVLTRLFHELMTETGARKRRIVDTIRSVHRASGLGWTPLIRDALAAGDLL